MPTTRPRIVVTETDAVALALDQAARRWPDDADSRSKLLLRLVEAGHRLISGSDQQLVEDRRALIARASGSGRGLYQDDYLERLRQDWPE